MNKHPSIEDNEQI